MSPERTIAVGARPEAGESCNPGNCPTDVRA